MEQKNERIKKSEILAFALANSSGRQIVSAVIATYILAFMTDVYGISAGAVGIIMGCATVFDALNDPVMGVIADRTKTKWGHYRPYLLWIPIPLAISTIILFATPELSAAGKIGYFAATYILYQVLMTAIDVPMNAMIPTISANENDRGGMTQMSAFLASIVLVIMTGGTPILVNVLGQGNQSKGYMLVMVGAGVLMILTCFWGFAKCKERVTVDKESVGLKTELLKIAQHKKALIPVLLIWCFSSLGFQITMSASVYYCNWYLGRPDMMGIFMGITSLAGIVGIVIFVPIFNKIFKGSIKGMYAGSQIMSAIVCLIVFFVGKVSLPLTLFLMFVSTALAALSNVYLLNLTVEMTDYIRYTTGEQLNGLMASIKGFAYKGGTALSTVVLGQILSITGYVGSASEQTTMAITGVNIARFLIPCISGVLVWVFFRMYPVTDEMKAKMKETIHN